MKPGPLICDSKYWGEGAFFSWICMETVNFKVTACLEHVPQYPQGLTINLWHVRLS